MNDYRTTGFGRLRALTVALAAAAVLSCGGEPPAAGSRRAEREAGELALPPSASAPRVMRESAPPDTIRPDTVEEFAILGGDSFPPVDLRVGGSDPDLSIDAIADSYRGHYAQAVGSEGTAVRNRIDRELQQEAERRTARDRGFADWIEMIGALSPDQRARLVDRLNEANIELARDLHGSGGPPEPDGTGPEG